MADGCLEGSMNGFDGLVYSMGYVRVFLQCFIIEPSVYIVVTVRV